MTVLALSILLFSAFLHAFWNFLSKRRNPPAAFFLMASLAAAGLCLPLVGLYWRGVVRIPPLAWALIAVTGAVQALYYIFLAAAYRTGDLSHAYPLARALPVVLVALISVLLGRGGQIQPLAYAGFFLVTLGCVVLPLPGFSGLRWRDYRHAWVLFALLAAGCITTYTLIDDQSLRILRGLDASPLSNLEWSLLYVELETISLSLFLLIFLLAWKPERRILLTSTGREWLQAGMLGLLITLTYGMVLLSMAHVTNVSYVSAFRQISIPIGAALGIFWRKETASAPKLTGIALVVLGLMLAVL